jgi:hypothetical protein
MRNETFNVNKTGFWAENNKMSAEINELLTGPLEK